LFDEVLKRVLADVDGARCVLLAGLDGVVVAAAVADGSPSPDLVAASMADLFRKADAAHRDAGLVTPMELASGSLEGRAVLRAVTADYLLVAALEGSGSLGRMRFALRKAADALQPELA